MIRLCQGETEIPRVLLAAEPVSAVSGTCTEPVGMNEYGYEESITYGDGRVCKLFILRSVRFHSGSLQHFHVL